jgi:two-component system, NarL family, invasion response regulator UvrY
MITILIADDHPIVRQGLKQILGEETDMAVIDEAKNGQEVLEKFREHNFDVIILDLSMPGISGMDVLKQIKKEKPKQSVLILSHYPEEQYAIPALKAGAAGYIPKTSIVEELVETIRRVSTGRKYISLSLAEKIIDYDSGAEKPLYRTLSDREYEVMCLIASGQSISDIAEKLCLSRTTISTYRSRVMRKLKIANEAELVRYVLANNLIN